MDLAKGSPVHHLYASSSWNLQYARSNCVQVSCSMLHVLVELLLLLGFLYVCFHICFHLLLLGFWLLGPLIYQTAQRHNSHCLRHRQSLCHANFVEMARCMYNIQISKLYKKSKWSSSSKTNSLLPSSPGTRNSCPSMVAQDVIEHWGL